MKTNRHQIICRILAGITLSFACSPCYGFTVDKIQYSILSEEDQTVAISKYDFSLPDKVFDIPKEITYNDKTYYVVEIGPFAFANPADSNLEEVNMPSSITRINNNAFSRNTTLKIINLSPAIEVIDESAFYLCESLESIEFPEGVKTIGQDCFYKCKALKSVSFPSTLETIGNWAFSYCSGLESITFSTGLKNLGSSAFTSCSVLREVTVPDSITEFGFSIFSDCTSLVKIELPESLETIPDGLLRSCKNLHSIQIPASVKRIGDSAFQEAGLTSIELPETVEYIGNFSFFRCNFSSFTIPTSLTSLGMGAFVECLELTSFIVPDNNPVYSTEDGILYNKDKSVLYSWPAAQGYVEIPDGIKTVGFGAFEGNSSIKTIKVPASVTYFDNFAFTDCYNVREMICLPSIPPETEMFSLYFEGYPELHKYRLKIYVPSESLDLYKRVWSFFKDKIFPLDENNGVEEIVDSSQSESTGPFTVYSLDGRFLMKARNADELQSLTKGIYIINGKKKFVK